MEEIEVKASDTDNKYLMEEIQKARKDVGRKMLSDEQILILACECISRTFTHEEKKYYQ